MLDVPKMPLSSRREGEPLGKRESFVVASSSLKLPSLERPTEESDVAHLNLPREIIVADPNEARRGSMRGSVMRLRRSSSAAV